MHCMLYAGLCTSAIGSWCKGLAHGRGRPKVGKNCTALADKNRPAGVRIKSKKRGIRSRDRLGMP